MVFIKAIDYLYSTNVCYDENWCRVPLVTPAFLLAVSITIMRSLDHVVSEIVLCVNTENLYRLNDHSFKKWVQENPSNLFYKELKGKIIIKKFNKSKTYLQMFIFYNFTLLALLNNYWKRFNLKIKMNIFVYLIRYIVIIHYIKGLV